MSGTGGRRSPLPAGKDYTKEHLGTAVNDLTRILTLIHSKPIRSTGSGNPVCFDGVKAQDIADLMNVTDELLAMLTNAKPVHKVKANAERMLDAMNEFCLGMRGRDASTGSDGTVYPSVPSKNEALAALDIAENKAWVKNFDKNFKFLYEDKLQDVYNANNEAFISHGLSTAELLAAGFTQDDLNNTAWADLIQKALDENKTEIAWKLIVLAMRVLITQELIAALEVDTGIRPVSRAAPPPPPPSGGGRLGVDDDDQPADPPPPAPAGDRTRRGEKQALKGKVEVWPSNLMSDAALLVDALGIKAAHQKDKLSGTRTARKAANWRTPQITSNIAYSGHAATPDLQISVEGGKVVGKVKKDSSTTARENLYEITPYSRATKKLTITCHPDAVIDPRLDPRLTGGVGDDMLLSQSYLGAQQARYQITDAVRVVCSDPKFAGKPAIIIRAELVDDSLPNKPVRAPKAGDKDDALRLISLAILAFNADPRVIVKLPTREYNFLQTMRATMPAVNTFLNFYDPIAAKVNTTPVPAFIDAEVGAWREQYLDLYATNLKALKRR